MDDDRNFPFQLDTSVLVPIAIAGGIALVVLVLAYCFRNFIYSKVLARNRVRADSGGSGRGGYPSASVPTRRVTIEPQRRRGVSENLAALQHQFFMPWSTRGFYQRDVDAHGQRLSPPSSHNRTNYHSTQVCQ